MNERILQVSLKALIKNEKGEYLFLKRSRPYEGESELRWDVPGGKLIPGEPIIDSLAREIFEETKLSLQGTPRVVESSDILRIAGKHTVRLTFEADVQAVYPVILDPDEHIEFRWLSAPEAILLHHDIYLTPSLKRLVTA